jgi:hypothetical protein
MLPVISIIYFLSCGVTSLILWFRMLEVLENKGRRVNSFWVTPQQFIEFSRVINEEKNLNLKKKYRILLWTQVALIPFFIFGSFILIGLMS